MKTFTIELIIPSLSSSSIFFIREGSMEEGFNNIISILLIACSLSMMLMFPKNNFISLVDIGLYSAVDIMRLENENKRTDSFLHLY